MKQFIIIFTLLVISIMIGCKRFPNIGEGYKLDYNSFGDIGIVNLQNTYLIHGAILDYAYDARFIIAVERPRDSVPECTGKISGMTLKRCDEAFKRSTFKQFWIIDKSSTSIWGPYQKDMFLSKKKELGVSDNLRFKTE